MPAVTPNRNYPYPVATDPADVPGALEDLALAVETDVQFQYGRIRMRNMAKAWRTTPNTYTNWTSGLALFIPLDDGFQINVNNGFELVGNRLYPTAPGFYIFTATVSYPVVSLVTPYPQVRFAEVWANGSVLLGSDSISNDLITVDGSVEVQAAGGRLMNGTTDYVQVAARIYSNNAATLPNVQINTRSILGLRMTQV